MRERAIRFGRSTPLIGVLTEPAQPSPGLPAVLMLNSGILHHVGASRLHVQLARWLSARGYITLRFDLSGIGDSEARKDTLPFEQSAVMETREAMDHLAQQKGVTKFVLFGLCSGADMAFKVALVDDRVAGVVQLDAWAYRTIGYYVRHYGRRARHLGAWTNAARRLVRRVAASQTPAPAAEERGPDLETSAYRRRFPPRESVAADLRTIAGRGTELLYIFSGDQSEHYNHQTQYRTSFRDVDFGERLRVEYVGEADHLFTRLDHQRWVLTTVEEWIAARVPPMNSPRSPGGQIASPTPARELLPT